MALTYTSMSFLRLVLVGPTIVFLLTMLADYRLLRCHCRQLVQRSQYECMDVVGVLRRQHRNCPTAALHCKLLVNHLVFEDQSKP